MESTERELLYSGSFGAGKTRVGCEKGNFLSLYYPGNKGLIIRKDFTALRDTTMQTFFEEVCLPSHIQSFNKHESKLIYKNGSEILFYGMNAPNRVEAINTRIGSLNRAWIFADEIVEFSFSDYQMLLGRLRTNTVPFHQIFGACNPSNPQHWLYDRFWKDTELKRKGVTKVVQSNSDSNPFTPESYKESLNLFKGKYKERFVQGLWVSFEGLIYDVWDVSKHILPRDTKKLGLTGDKNKPIPEDWDRFRSIDFGFTNPLVCQWWAGPRYKYAGEIGKQDRVLIPWDERYFILYKQIYYSGRTCEEHARDIRRYSIGEEFQSTFADHAAGDRATLEQAGIPTQKANKDVSSGIQSVYEAIGSDKLYVLEESLLEYDIALEANKLPTKTEDEFSGYNRSKGKDGKYNPTEKPLKLNDHGMDAMRYFYHSLNVLHGGDSVVVVGDKQATAQDNGSGGRFQIDRGYARRNYAEVGQLSLDRGRKWLR